MAVEGLAQGPNIVNNSRLLDHPTVCQPHHLPNFLPVPHLAPTRLRLVLSSYTVPTVIMWASQIKVTT